MTYEIIIKIFKCTHFIKITNFSDNDSSIEENSKEFENNTNEISIKNLNFNNFQTQNKK